MADKNINQLPEVTAMGVTDLFVLEQAGAAKKLTGQLLKASLMTWLDGHGGVKSFAYDEDTGKVTIATTDGTTLTTGDLRGKNGRMIHAYDLGEQGSPGEYLITSFPSANPMPEDWAAGDLILSGYGDMWVISNITPTDDGYEVRFDFTVSLVGPQGDSPTIGSNGHWWVGDTDTGVVARGDTGTHGSDVTVTSAAVEGTDEHPNGGVKLIITETVYDADGAVSQVNTTEKTIWNGNTGPTGPQGTAPHIGDNGHWYVGDVDTGINAKGDKGDGLKIDGSVPTYADLPALTAADMGKTYLVDADGRLYFWSGTAWPASGQGLLIKGEDGVTPNIGANGHWFIGTEDTGVSAQGPAGKDGTLAEITGAASTIASADLTAKRALVSNASGKVGVASTTLQELNYLHGVTSAVQTQLDAKQDKIMANGFLRGDGAGNVIADKPVYIVSPIFVGAETAIISSDDTVISIYEKLAAGYDVILRENVVSVSGATTKTTARQFICQRYQKLTSSDRYNIWFYDVSSSGATILFGSSRPNDSDSDKKTLTVSTQEFGTNPSSTLITLTAADWDSGVQTVAVTGLLAASNGTLAIDQSATDEQWEAWSAAAVRATAQANGSLTLQAMGDVPTVDIPVEVIIL